MKRPDGGRNGSALRAANGYRDGTLMDVGSILLACIGIGLLIFIHELGHFIAARLAGVRVEVFSLGFGPRLFGVELGGTDFRVSLMPFGGFVMVAGQDPTDRRYPTRES